MSLTLLKKGDPTVQVLLLEQKTNGIPIYKGVQSQVLGTGSRDDNDNTINIPCSGLTLIPHAHELNTMRKILKMSHDIQNVV